MINLDHAGDPCGPDARLLVKTGTLRETEPATPSDLLERPGQLAFNLHRQINYVANHGAHPDTTPKRLYRRRWVSFAKIRTSERNHSL